MNNDITLSKEEQDALDNIFLNPSKPNKELRELFNESYQRLFKRFVTDNCDYISNMEDLRKLEEAMKFLDKLFGEIESL